MLGTSSKPTKSLIPRSSPELERRAAATAARTAAPERHPFPVLPPGWAIIGRCRFGTGTPGPDATGCYALAHPDVGIALIDIAPDATPNAEARLRRALTAVEFWPDYPGTLPVVHDRVDGTALRSLPWVLERGFAAQPVLTIPGGMAWIEGVQRAMAADPAWELPGQPKAQADAPPAPADEVEGDDEAPPPPPPRRWGRLAALPLAFAATFAIGLVTGFVLLDSPAPIAQPVVATLPHQPAPAPTALSSAAVPADTAPRAAETTAAAATAPAATTPSVAGTPTPAAVVAPAPVPAPAMAPPTSAAATPAPVSQPTAPGAAAGATPPLAPAELAAAPNGSNGGGGAPAAPATSHSPMEMQVSHLAPAARALPAAPPPAPAPPPVRVSAAQQAARPGPVIDRACSQALFRFQQGERLTAAEQNFIRTGCSTSRGGR